MKVITQLIRHFWERGVLTAEEVEYLLRHGFARRQDVPGFEFPTVYEPLDPLDGEQIVPLPAGEFDHLEERLVRRQPLRRASHEPHAREVKIEELLERLRSEFARRAEDLKSILALSQRFHAVESWERGLAELRTVTDDHFFAELCSGLKTGSVLMGDFWQATEIEPFHRLLEEDEVRGQTARAFLASLVSDPLSQLGKYAWILRHDEIQCLLNLRAVHARFLKNLCRLYQHDRHLLSRALEANRDLVQVWSLILLYNAHRDPHAGDTPDYRHEYGPLTLPGAAVWRSAWTCALQMDRQPVSQLLMTCYDASDQDDLDCSESCRRPLMCPAGWHIPDEITA